MNKIFKYINPIYWIKRRKAKKIYKILINAKHFYVEHINKSNCIGMCACIQNALEDKIGLIPIDQIYKLIPEFNKQFCEASRMTSMFWWPIDDIESRIKAFNKLIKCYMNKMN